MIFDRGERVIVRKIVSDALEREWLASVFDGEEWTVRKSPNIDEIMESLGTTDEDQIVFRTIDGEKVGWMYLVYGNSPEEVVCDYTANEEMQGLIDPITANAETYLSDIADAFYDVLDALQRMTRQYREGIFDDATLSHAEHALARAKGL